MPIPQESVYAFTDRKNRRKIHTHYVVNYSSNQLFCSLFFYIKVLVYVRQLNLKLIYKNAHQLFDEMQSMINKLNVVPVQQLLANTLYLHNYIRYLIKHTNLWQFNPKF
ncbi:hypothetical protein LXL04_019109 [Taraxacum kok-saghyz]